MSDSTAVETSLDASVDVTGTAALRHAVVAGLGAGVVFGLLIQFALGRMTAIGAMYTLGAPSLSVGWVAHLGHSALFGLVFGVLTWWRPLGRLAGGRPTGPGVGAGFGFVLWFVNIGFLWPLWLNAVGLVELPVPFLVDPMALRAMAGHLLWGALLGLLFALLRAR